MLPPPRILYQYYRQHLWKQQFAPDHNDMNFANDYPGPITYFNNNLQSIEKLLPNTNTQYNIYYLYIIYNIYIIAMGERISE